MLPHCQAAFVLRHFSTKPPSRSLDSPTHEGNMIMLAESEIRDCLISRPLLLLDVLATNAAVQCAATSLRPGKSSKPGRTADSMMKSDCLPVRATDRSFWICAAMVIRHLYHYNRADCP
jgi:hypothetical protein